MCRAGTAIAAVNSAMERNDYAEAFETGYSATRSFLLAHGAPLDDAEEIAQAAWVRGWECRDQLRDPGMVGFWVNSIARNLYRARFRGPMATPIDNVNASYSMDLESLELRRLLERNLEGYSAEEIAREAGITSTGIRVRLLRIRNMLKEQLAPAA